MDRYAVPVRNPLFIGYRTGFLKHLLEFGRSYIINNVLDLFTTGYLFYSEQRFQIAQKGVR
jgi:hypothetical protein